MVETSQKLKQKVPTKNINIKKSAVVLWNYFGSIITINKLNKIKALVSLKFGQKIDR